jgi:hypothetical protein
MRRHCDANIAASLSCAGQHPQCDRHTHFEAANSAAGVLALLVLSFAASGRSFRSGVELVWFAETTHSADRHAALFDSDEPTISAARSPVGSAPFIGISGSRAGDEG